jgi:hypothetical protein
MRERRKEGKDVGGGSAFDVNGRKGDAKRESVASERSEGCEWWVCHKGGMKRLNNYSIASLAQRW